MLPWGDITAQAIRSCGAPDGSLSEVVSSYAAMGTCQSAPPAPTGTHQRRTHLPAGAAAPADDQTDAAAPLRRAARQGIFAPMRAPADLYALAAGDVPQGLRDDFLAQAERGEAVTSTTAASISAAARSLKSPCVNRCGHTATIVSHLWNLCLH